ncbi:phage terminase small subunit [Vibrio cholerae]|uniref:phage terminase small subunit n=1 Tax=Vibrio cholerae TaxID=666 RepID=UPI00027348B0|nr:terminase endonuclease subunit [Vibrio cholerae]EGR4245780.1 terminase [Vibrio cholerae]EJH64607.1 phage small terminase subunit [Vibrio cholerae HE-45]
MSLSPAARHKLAVLATPAAAAHAATAESLDSLHLRLVEFEQDKQVLKGFVQISEKVNHKRDVLIPKYKPLAEKYLAAGESYQNPIFTDLIVWLFDIGDLETAVEWLFKAIELNLPTPENFKRSSWAVICADEVLKWAEQQLPNGHSIEPYFSRVFEKIDKEWKLPEKLEAKWYKFAGYGLLMNEKGEPQPSSIGDLERLQKAKALLITAHEKHDKIGVKTKINQIDMRINAINEGKNL